MRPFPDITMKRRNRSIIHSGLSLLEALVTIVVVSVGLLGILGLQTASVVNTRVSAFRSNATILAHNFAERMRANPQGNYNNIIVADDETSITINGEGFTEDSPDCNNRCTVAQITQYDAREWQKAISKKLPNGEGYVDCITDDADCDSERYYITMAWAERSRDDDLCHTGPHKGLTKRCVVTEVRP